MMIRSQQVSLPKISAFHWMALVALAVGSSFALPAFPSAEGFGANAIGGRGGEVFHVTNLNDSGTGSLRDAFSKAGRTIVFDVGGVIRIQERLIVPDHTTIAGQTAPGGGITIYGNGVAYNTNNVITRHVRIRMGKVGTSGKDAISIANGHDMIWDHVSVSWGRDGTFDVNPDSDPITNITIQNCIIGQGLQTHSTGGLMISPSASILRTLYIDNNSRNPKARQTTQFVNNVIYNWTVSGYILGDTEGRSDGYMVGNYFITGPNTNGGTLDSPTAAYHIFATGNYYDSDKNGTLNGRLLGKGDYGVATWETTPSVSFPAVKELAADSAYRLVFKNAGASRWRDAVDSVLFYQLASLGKVGAQISDEASLGLPDIVGKIPSGVALTDTDRDGMPDAWETAHGLSISNAADRNGTQLSVDGYTNLEMYLNELAGDLVVYKITTAIHKRDGVGAGRVEGTLIGGELRFSSAPMGEYTVQIRNLKGEVVLNKANQGTSSIAVTGLPKGWYIVEILQGTRVLGRFRALHPVP